MQRAELKIRDAFFSLNHALGLTLTGMAEAPLDQLLSEHFGPEVAAVVGGGLSKSFMPTRSLINLQADLGEPS